jgi:hypothetical protein
MVARAVRGAKLSDIERGRGSLSGKACDWLAIGRRNMFIRNSNLLTSDRLAQLKNAQRGKDITHAPGKAVRLQFADLKESPYFFDNLQASHESC